MLRKLEWFRGHTGHTHSCDVTLEKPEWLRGRKHSWTHLQLRTAQLWRVAVDREREPVWGNGVRRMQQLCPVGPGRKEDAASVSVCWVQGGRGCSKCAQIHGYTGTRRASSQDAVCDPAARAVRSSCSVFHSPATTPTRASYAACLRFSALMVRSPMMISSRYASSCVYWERGMRGRAGGWSASDAGW